MNKKELAELKKRFTIDRASFDRLSGCYVDAEKKKICSFSKQFLSLPEEEQFKYLDIARKCFCGNLGNNLIEHEFPSAEETAGGKQQILMALKENPEDESLLNAYYDLIIQEYDACGNYLILVYHDNYDVMKKGTDNHALESEEVYTYLIIAICPVKLDKPALAYSAEDNGVESRKQDWIVKAPDTAVVFPAFSDRSTDIHSCMTYSRDTKTPHPEFVENVLGCEATETMDEKLEGFYDIVRGSFGNEEKADQAILSFTKAVSDRIEAGEDKTSRFTKDDIQNLLSSDGRFSADVVQPIAQGFESTGAELPVSVLANKTLLKKNEERLKVMELEDTVAELKDALSAGFEENQNGQGCEKVKIAVPAGMENCVEINKIDGRNMFCIFADGCPVFVNGHLIGGQGSMAGTQ